MFAAVLQQEVLRRANLPECSTPMRTFREVEIARVELEKQEKERKEAEERKAEEKAAEGKEE